MALVTFQKLVVTNNAALATEQVGSQRCRWMSLEHALDLPGVQLGDLIQGMSEAVQGLDPSQEPDTVRRYKATSNYEEQHGDLIIKGTLMVERNVD